MDFTSNYLSVISQRGLVFSCQTCESWSQGLATVSKAVKVKSSHASSQLPLVSREPRLIQGENSLLSFLIWHLAPAVVKLQ